MRDHKHFHFHFCTTTLDDSAGEWHQCLTGTGRKCIFHCSNEETGSPLRRTEILYSGNDDLRFVPVIRYLGTPDNGEDRILLELETKCQSKCHLKLPVGTVGWRYHKAGTPRPFNGASRVCTLYFVYSESKFLEQVEAGTLGISPTKLGRGNRGYNLTVWDSTTWAPVNTLKEPSIRPLLPWDSHFPQFGPRLSVYVLQARHERQRPRLFSADRQATVKRR